MRSAAPFFTYSDDDSEFREDTGSLLGVFRIRGLSPIPARSLIQFQGEFFLIHFG